MRELKNKLTVGKNTRNTQNKKAKSFGYQILGFGSGGEGAAFIEATGGCVSTCGDFKIHTFNGPGTFEITKGSGADNLKVDYLVIAGGGAGAGSGGQGSPGGGAGGARFSDGTTTGCYSAGPSPLSAPGLAVCVQSYPITVGGGGAAQPATPSGTAGNIGCNSVFSSITSAGGGSSRISAGSPDPTQSGGSGAGGRAGGSGGSGNTPPVSPPQGNNGGNGPSGSPTFNGGGGGGATGAGSNCNPSGPSGPGGAGVTSCITGSPVARAGGGAGGQGQTQGIGSASAGGGAGGARHNGTGGNGSANTGGGGGGASIGPPPFGVIGSGGGGAGGSGIVVIRYRFQ